MGLHKIHYYIIETLNKFKHLCKILRLLRRVLVLPLDLFLQGECLVRDFLVVHQGELLVALAASSEPRESEERDQGGQD